VVSRFAAEREKRRTIPTGEKSCYIRSSFQPTPVCKKLSVRYQYSLINCICWRNNSQPKLKTVRHGNTNPRRSVPTPGRISNLLDGRLASEQLHTISNMYAIDQDICGRQISTHLRFLHRLQVELSSTRCASFFDRIYV
jgi:hypothetical protein